ncbi:MAG: M24B family metallopeptidase, partial [Cyanobacteria bacterium P01_F01_bin.42]
VTPTGEEIGTRLQVDQVLPRSELRRWQGKSFSTIRSQDPYARLEQETLGFEFGAAITGTEQRLAEAIIQQRMRQDSGAIAEIRRAVAVTLQAHRTGLGATREARSEADVRAAIEAVFMAHNMTSAYGSIVTIHGEVLHNQSYHHPIHAGDLLLVDAGAETELGWAADVTRTWPVSGKFSPTQRDLYQVVLAAHDACIDAIAPGVEYREIHLLASRIIAEGLVSLGILIGNPESLISQDIQAYFFPHGVGHLLGLDVHDMEDLGDLAGYGAERTRSDRMGLQFLRLDRPLQGQMVVTIEPGFYQIPGLLDQARQHPEVSSQINWDRLAQFADVRGIRIEDDVLVQDGGAEVLTAALPTDCEQICGLMA